MAVIQGSENLLDQLSSLIFVETFLLNNLIEEFAAQTEIGDDVKTFLILEELVNFDDVGMILQN
jgi:hypothetical protein